MKLIIKIFLMGCLWIPSFLASAEVVPEDPLQSVMWEFVYKTHLQTHPVQFDPQVEVITPERAENSMQFPVSVEWTGEEKVVKMVLLADLNPIIKVMTYFPHEARPSFAARIKIQQGSPIRGAVLTVDGVWHVNGRYVDASGGGCTAPSVAKSLVAWENHYGELRAAVWPGQSDYDRLRFMVMHPMDTGLADGIPRFIIEHVDVRDATDDRLLAKMELHEPVSENPFISLDLKHAQNGYKLYLRDDSGTQMEGVIDSSASPLKTVSTE